MDINLVRQQLHQQIDMLPDEVIQVVAEFTAFIKFRQGLSTRDNNRLNDQSTDVIFEVFQSENSRKESLNQTIDRLCGSWSGDPTIPPIFEEIALQRQRSKPRDISFDLPS